jgi:hypothetical protein
MSFLSVTHLATRDASQASPDKRSWLHSGHQLRGIAKFEKSPRVLKNSELLLADQASNVEGSDERRLLHFLLSSVQS